MFREFLKGSMMMRRPSRSIVLVNTFDYWKCISKHVTLSYSICLSSQRRRSQVLMSILIPHSSWNKPISWYWLLQLVFVWKYWSWWDLGEALSWSIFLITENASVSMWLILIYLFWWLIREASSYVFQFLAAPGINQSPGIGCYSWWIVMLGLSIAWGPCKVSLSLTLN
jgi:hypothetical protein